MTTTIRIKDDMPRINKKQLKENVEALMRQFNIPRSHIIVDYNMAKWLFLEEENEP